jgi:selenocysteine lyase/cysteine desulfurase
MLTTAMHPDALPGDRSYFTALREQEFARLDAAGETYVDYTGSGLYAERQVRAHAELLQHSVLGNPHSESRSSRASTAMIEDARHRVLRFLDADETEWEVAFTHNASAAIRLVGESYPFGPDRSFVLAADNHNSVNGLREIARSHGASVHYLPLDSSLLLDEPEQRLVELASRGMSGLVAFPAQSNFSGVRHSLSLVSQAKRLGFDVLLDAAAFVPTAALSLRDVDADFVPLSFYKMFGYPTGIGALVARRSALAQLRRPWFAGGTVQFASVQRAVHLLKPGAEGFEDGTPSFLTIGALPLGFDLLDEVGMQRLGRRMAHLTDGLLSRLRALTHRDGRPVLAIYAGEAATRGACVSLNAIDANDRVVPFEDVESRARDLGVSLRGGCFCNPGAAEYAFGGPVDVVARCQDSAAAVGFTPARLRDCLDGGPVGAVRISLGLATIERDLERAVEVLADVARV